MSLAKDVAKQIETYLYLYGQTCPKLAESLLKISRDTMLRQEIELIEALEGYSEVLEILTERICNEKQEKRANTDKGRWL